jgi:TldD protein
MFEIAAAAVDAAVAAGAVYADARVFVRKQQSLACQNQIIESMAQGEEAGVGVRALVGSSWGFAAVPDLTVAAATAAGRRSVVVARASASVPGDDLRLADVPAVEAAYETPHVENPMNVSLGEKSDLLVGVTEIMQGVPGIALANASLAFWDTEKWFVSSQGHRIFQHIVESGGGMSAMAIGESETQIRSYPQSFGQFETGGYEVIRGFDLMGNAGWIAEEAVQLLSAAQCEEGEKQLILEGSQLALQIHESVGHAIELDRILGWEAAFAGTSFLDLAQLGSLRYGSELMNITADATIPGALGTFGFDDEGTPAQSVDIVKEGTWVGALTGRDSAAIAGVAPGGMVRADGYNRLPMVRMTNVGLVAGDASLAEIISETRDGIYMSTNRSWSIDDKRLNFQFGCEVGWEVKDGTIGRMVKNPTYTGITPQFWGTMDMLAGGSEYVHWGTPNCGKGQPVQVGHTGHSAAPARFSKVRVGVST